jgi:cation-transporting ATPase 13A1
LYDEVHGELNNRCTVLVQPCKHKGRPALVQVQSSKVGCGLVVEYQRELYEYWGPDDDGNGGVPGSNDVAEDEEDDDMFKMKNASKVVAVEDSDSESDDGVGDVVVVDERTQLVGKGGENGSLRRISPPVAFNLEYYTRAKGLDQRAVFASQGRYGKNVVEVRIPTFLALYKEQLLSPISMFQVFTSLLWILDAYWQYVGFTLFSIIVMEAGTVMQRQKTLKSLSGMSAKSAPVFCFRDGKWGQVDSEELLPGDLISLSRAVRKVEEPAKEEEPKEDGKIDDEPKAPKRKAQKVVHVVPCDCLVVRGGAVCNEATLTGESTPQMKDAIVADDGRALDVQGRDRVAVLFSGTELVNANDDLRNINDKDPDHVPPAPDGGCVAFVLRTGFSSSQGELVQMIEFSQQQVSSDTRETLGALFVLLLFAIVSAAYVLKAGCVPCRKSVPYSVERASTFAKSDFKRVGWPRATGRRTSWF